MKKNNLIFYHILIIIAAAACLFLPWGSFVSQSTYFGGVPITTTGLNGTLRLYFIKIPHWLLILTLSLSAFISILTMKKTIQIPKIVPILMDIFVLLWIGLGFYFYLSVGSVGLALFVMAIASLASLLLKFIVKKVK